MALGMEQPAWVGALLGLGFMAVLLGLDVIFARFTLREFSHATVGLAIGLFGVYLVWHHKNGRLTFGKQTGGK